MYSGASIPPEVMVRPSPRWPDGPPIFSERELVRYNYVVVRPSFCLTSETFVHLTQALEIFGNVFTPVNTLAI